MKFYNRTRVSKSIPARLVKEKKFHLIPLYYLLMLSHLGKEGINNGGSYEFADHIYYGKPKGRYGIGYVIDFILLNLKSARSFRFRYTSAKEEIKLFVNSVKKRGKIRIATIPSGYAREIFEMDRELKQSNNSNYDKIEWHLLDLDKELLKEVENKNPLKNVHYWPGDALSDKPYNDMGKLDLIISIGFTEFLNDGQTLEFYKKMSKQLNRGGIFITSGMISHKLSDYLLKNIAELKTSYRDKEDLIKLGVGAGFKLQRVYQDKDMIQTMLVLEKL